MGSKKRKMKLRALKILIAVLLTGCLAGEKGREKKFHSADGLSISSARDTSSFRPGEIWYDLSGEIINAHGGGMLYFGKKYYWFGEKRGKHASQGVNVYSSMDLYHWKFESLALSPSNDPQSDIA